MPFWKKKEEDNFPDDIRKAFAKSGVRCLDVVPKIPDFEPYFCNPFRIKIILLTDEILTLLPRFGPIEPNCPICGNEAKDGLRAHAFVDFQKNRGLGLQVKVHADCIADAKVDNSDIPIPW